MPVPAVRRVVPMLPVAVATLAHAAHPLISEDTGTQGTGRFELEVGTSFSARDGGHAFEVDPQLSYGAVAEVDLILRPTMLWLSGGAAQAAGRHAGFGSTSLDFKWRAVRYGDVSLGVRAGMDIPTATTGFGPHEPGAHAIGIATYEATGVLAIANLAYSHLPRDDGLGNRERQNVVRASAAYVREVFSGVSMLVEGAVVRSPDPATGTWPAVAQVGAIAHLPHRFDFDVGWQGRLNHAAPASVWLAGMTFHW